MDRIIPSSQFIVDQLKNFLALTGSWSKWIVRARATDLNVRTSEGQMSGELTPGLFYRSCSPPGLYMPTLMSICTYAYIIWYEVEKDPQNINWDKRQVCLVVEGSGAFTTTKGANLHIQGGARRVIITAPSSDAPTIAYGVNHNTYDPSTVPILSCASCTTNCIAPIAKLLHEKFCIVEGMVTTIHATTVTQRTVDGPSKKDWRGVGMSYQRQ